MIRLLRIRRSLRGNSIMADEDKSNGKKKISKTVWSVIAGTVVVLSLIAGIFTFDDRYVKCEILDVKLAQAETNSVKTFESFQMRQAQDVRKLQIQIRDLEYNNSLKRYYELQRQLSANPNDTYLRDECQSVKDDLKRIKEKKQKLLE